MFGRKLFFFFWFLIFCFSRVLFAAAPAAEKGSDPAIAAVEESLDAWRLAEAQRLIADLARARAKSPEVLDLQAWLAFYQGRYDEAVRIVEASLAVDPNKESRQGLRLLAQRTGDVVRKLKPYESAHFIVYLDPARDEILAPLALDALEKSYHALGEVFGYRPESKVRVEIAPDAQSFNAISTLSLRDIEETGAVGICKFNKIMTISPRALVQGYRWLDSLSHEYAHYVIVGASRNKAPIWLHEGLARFYETRWRMNQAPARPDYLTLPNETLLAYALQRDGFVGFKKMEPSLIYLESPEQVQLAYAEAASAIDFIVEKKGAGAVRRLMAELQQKPTPQAIEALLGMPYGDFESQWKAFLKAKGLKPTEGIRVRRLKVRGEKDTEEAVELKEIQSEVARTRTHLGDRLRERGRVVAAAQEYRRALQGSPHSTIILNKLARALIQMGQFEEALSHLSTAERLDPDNVTTMVLLGRARHATKDYRGARTALEAAIHINPFDPTIYQILYEAESALGEAARAEQAKATLEKLLRPR
ncbi:MAG TPA: tetratricopeptide repeat protein [Candidatus Acidoferrales bacterium]|nr:tetratricopeptide repeat protein [Candidatus Acidoferrales bacterium]